MNAAPHGPAPPDNENQDYEKAVRESSHANANALRTMRKQSHYVRDNAILSQFGRAGESIRSQEQAETLRHQRLLEQQRPGQVLTIFGELDTVESIAGLIQRAKQNLARTRMINLFKTDAVQGTLGAYKTMFN